ncbi:MAG TPA: hypothetical protein VK026_10280 [Paenalcaligenes sp.]|nr:hypothetical protein [Paenalcaligenes sp.]
MRIALFLIGAIAAIYLIVKGFKQVLAESRQSIEEERRQQIHHESSEHDEDER